MGEVKSEQEIEETNSVTTVTELLVNVLETGPRTISSNN